MHIYVIRRRCRRRCCRSAKKVHSHNRWSDRIVCACGFFVVFRAGRNQYFCSTKSNEIQFNGRKGKNERTRNEKKRNGIGTGVSSSCCTKLQCTIALQYNIGRRHRLQYMYKSYWPFYFPLNNKTKFTINNKSIILLMLMHVCVRACVHALCDFTDSSSVLMRDCLHFLKRKKKGKKQNSLFSRPWLMPTIRKQKFWMPSSDRSHHLQSRRSLHFNSFSSGSILCFMRNWSAEN